VSPDGETTDDMIPGAGTCSTRLSGILDRLDGVSRQGSGWQARCPAHDDTRASLSLREAEDGRILAHCHAGCTFEQILQALELTPRDVAPDGSGPAFRDETGDQPWHDVAVYDYKDTDGNVRYQVVRRERVVNGEREKNFTQRRPDPARPGQYIYNLQGVERLLYRLSECLDAQQVFIVEGEKDVESLREGGLHAICNSGGAGKWPKNQSEHLRGKAVVILPDNDEPGLRHAQSVAAALSGIAASIKVIPTSARPKGDVTDWLAEGHSPEELLQLVAETPEWSGERLVPDGRTRTSPENGAKGGRPPKDIAAIANDLADSLRDANGVLTLRRYHGAWFRHDGCCYRQISQDEIEALVMEHLRKTGVKASRSCRDDVIANLAAADLAALPAAAANPCWLTSGYPPAREWLPTQGCLVNVRALARHIAGEEVPDGDLFREPTAELFSTYGVPYRYAPDARCPKWEAFLEGVQPVAADREMLQKLAGLCLTPNTAYNVFFCFSGPPGAGKSTFLEVLEALVGSDNVCCLPLASFATRFLTWQLATHLVNVVGEMPTEGERGAGLHAVEGILKDVCDGGLIPVEHKFRDPTTAPAIARSIFAMNALPRFSDRSGAIHDRLRIVPFDQVFRGTEAENRNLRKEIVEEELPGVLNWAVEGLAKLLGDRAFPEHSLGLARKAEHRSRCDPERTFLDERYELGTPDEGISSHATYQTYSQWAKDRGYSPRNEGNFSEAVRTHFGIEKARERIDGRHVTVYRGLKLRAD